MEQIETKSLATIESEFETNFKDGLTQVEAEKRLLANGKNELPVAKSKHWTIIFLHTLVEPLQIILFLAAIISVVAPKIGTSWNSFSFDDFMEFIVIVTIIIIDSILETVQTVKAKKSVNALKSLSKPRAVVIRDGIQTEIDANLLVLGDIVILESGKYVPAELRIIEASNFRIDEAVLTGESLPVDKNAQPIVQTNILAEQTNIAFMSTFTTSGRGVGVVIGVGVNTEIGKIATTINENSDNETPLEKKLSSFGYWISIFAAVIGIIIFVALIFSGNKNLWDSYLLVAITLAIGIIPESLGAVVSITLSLSTKKMATENVIVKKLASVETLGSVNVICTDKTGTLTQNKMTVKKVIINNQIFSSEEYIAFPATQQQEMFVKALVLPNDSSTENEERIGDPTELTLIDFVQLLKVDEENIRDQFSRLDEIPFDSERKLMTTVNQINDEQIVFTKGAIDSLIKICNRIQINDTILDFDEQAKLEFLKLTESLSEEALRILGFAYKSLDEAQLETDLIFLGGVGMIDPIRKEALKAIEEAHAAGIRVVMITGDHKTTALAIARDLDLALSEYEVMSSDVLKKMTQSELLRVIDNISVFARVNPEDKVRIVSALQEKGNIVSMTGDGVNDAPSLSIANIGTAMGIMGTDVAKQAADIILTDDNFGTIIKGVNEGRNVYQKIKRTIVLLMGFNLANVLAIFILSLLIKISPLEATNILFINLVVESCLAIAMGMGPNDKTLMKEKPTGSKTLLKGLLGSIFKIGIIGAGISILSFYLGMKVGMSFDSSQSLLIFNNGNVNHAFANWHQAMDSSVWTNLNIGKDEIVRFQDNAIVFGRTTMFVTMTISPLFYAHLIKLSNWKTTKKLDYTISIPMLYASLIALGAEIFVFFTPIINNTIFGLMNYGSTGWNENTIILLPIALGLALLIPLLIALFDLIRFYSYHINLKPWLTNRKIIFQMVENDRKEAIRQTRKKKA